MTRDKVSNEALFILRSLQENARTGRSNKLADVKVMPEQLDLTRAKVAAAWPR